MRAYTVKLDQPDPNEDLSEDIYEELLNAGLPVTEVSIWSEHTNTSPAISQLPLPGIFESSENPYLSNPNF